jgi:DNA replication protein DnaC
VYLSKDNESNLDDLIDSKVESLYDYINDKHIRVSQNQLQILKDSVESDSEPDNSTLKNYYNGFIRYYNELNNEVKLKDEAEFEVLPMEYEKGKRDVIYVSGASGSGKSYWIASYCKKFNKMTNNKAPIYFISAKKLTDESVYNDVKNIKQLSLDLEQLEEITEDGDAFQSFVNKNSSLVIFDDAEALSKQQQKYVDLIMESILQIGRSKNINCIISRHILNNGMKTKIIFNEINKLVVFPNGISRYNLIYCLKNYIGFDKHMIDKIIKIKSRWLLIHTHTPRYCIGQKQIFLV